MDTIATLWNADTPDAAEALLKTTAAKPLRLQNFVGNEFYKASSSADALESFNPRTGKVLVHVPSSSAADVDQAVDAASNAFPSWSRTPRQERARLLQKVAHLIQENKNLFAVWESIDQGKTLARAEAEVDRAATNFRYGLVAPDSPLLRRHEELWTNAAQHCYKQLFRPVYSPRGGDRPLRRRRVTRHGV